MGLMHYLDAPSHVLHSFQKPFQQGCTVPQARRLARTSANKASVFDDKGRPLQPFFFHPTQQLENECPDNELFWTDKAVWSTHLRKCHSEYWKQHVQAVKDAHLCSKYQLGSTADGLCCRGPFAGKIQQSQQQIQVCVYFVQHMIVVHIN